MALPDDDDGYPGRFERSDDLLRVVVPDDLRELAADVAAYHRELEHLRRQQRRQQFWYRFTPRWARGGLPSPVFTAVLLVVATTGLLLSVFAPVAQQQNQFPAAPLAHPKQAVGTPGGLTPDVQLVDDTGLISLRRIRPVVVVLVPPKCDCGAMIRQIVGQANEQAPAPYIVLVSAGSDTTAAKFASLTDDGHGPIAVRDPDSVLVKTYHASPTAPTLIFVKADGVTLAPQAFHDGDRIEAPLAKIRA